MVATAFADGGNGGQHGRGRSSSSGQQRSKPAQAATSNAPASYNEYRDMPCFAHRDAAGQCNHTNRNYKFVNDLKADEEVGYKQTRRPRPRGKGKADKETKDSSNMEEDPAPKTAEKAKGAGGGSNPFKATKCDVFHTFLGPPTAKAQKADMRSLNATVPAIP